MSAAAKDHAQAMAGLLNGREPTAEAKRAALAAMNGRTDPAAAVTPTAAGTPATGTTGADYRRLEMMSVSYSLVPAKPAVGPARGAAVGSALGSVAGPIGGAVGGWAGRALDGVAGLLHKGDATAPAKDGNAVVADLLRQILAKLGDTYSHHQNEARKDDAAQAQAIVRGGVRNDGVRLRGP